jgi:hypothetical protein
MHVKARTLQTVIPELQGFSATRCFGYLDMARKGLPKHARQGLPKHNFLTHTFTQQFHIQNSIPNQNIYHIPNTNALYFFPPIFRELSSKSRTKKKKEKPHTPEDLGTPNGTNTDNCVLFPLSSDEQKPVKLILECPIRMTTCSGGPKSIQ